MLQDIKNTIKHSAVYGLSKVALRAVSFILIPIYTDKFAPSSIANINLLESFWQYLFTICMFAVETAIINFCVSAKSELTQKKMLFNFFIILFFNSIILIVFSRIFSQQISVF